jgi:hypothetical protein
LSCDAPADIADIAAQHRLFLMKIGFNALVDFAASAAPQQTTQHGGDGGGNKCNPSCT